MLLVIDLDVVGGTRREKNTRHNTTIHTLPPSTLKSLKYSHNRAAKRFSSDSVGQIDEADCVAHQLVRSRYAANPCVTAPSRCVCSYHVMRFALWLNAALVRLFRMGSSGARCLLLNPPTRTCAPGVLLVMYSRVLCCDCMTFCCVYGGLWAMIHSPVM